MALRFVFGAADVNIDDLTLLECEAVDAIVNTALPKDSLGRVVAPVSWAVAEPQRTPTVARAVARVVLARNDPDNAETRANGMTVRELVDAFKVEDTPNPKAVTDGTASTPT